MGSASDNKRDSLRTPRRQPRLIALAVLGVLLFNYPLLSLFERGELFGLPLPVIYLFSAWALLIALAALALEGRAQKRSPGDAEQTDEAND